jgi:hypothetical protein
MSAHALQTQATAAEGEERVDGEAVEASLSISTLRTRFENLAANARIDAGPSVLRKTAFSDLPNRPEVRGEGAPVPLQRKSGSVSHCELGMFLADDL